ncbi:MAG: hypothetical protein KJ063_12455 [Anaerolineae bacterium]|nr:hypothetical protein [Anaerolineae bacterium]
MVHSTLPNGFSEPDLAEPFDLATSTLIHDLNNLLTAVISHATLALVKSDKGDGGRPHIERTVQAAKYAAALSRQLNLYAKNNHYQPDTTDLNSLVSEITELLQPVFLRNIKVQLNCLKDLPPIQAPRVQVQQILMNLLINAAEAMAEGKGEITIDTGQAAILNQFDTPGYHYRLAPQPGEYIYLRICDNGPGMSEQVLAGLLMPYFTTKPRGRGLGLMSVVKTLGEWGGGLTIESQVDRGSTFTIYFPIKESTRNQQP